MARNISVGIDVGTYSTNTVVLELDSKNGVPKILALNSVSSSGVRKGNVEDVKEAAETIKESIKGAEKVIGFPIRNVYASVGGVNLCSVLSKGMAAVSRADQEITEHDIKRAIEHSESSIPRMANKTIVHSIPLSFKVDGEPAGKNPAGMRGGKIEVETLFVIQTAQNINNLLKSFEGAGVNVDAFTASPVAAAKVLLNKRQREEGALICDIGGGTVALAAFEGGFPLYLAVFPFGSGIITNDIALVAQIPLEEAERMKHLYGSEETKLDQKTQRKLAEIIEARLQETFELTGNHLKKISRERLLPGGVVLTGGGANLPGLADFTKNHLKMNAEVGVCREFESKEKRFFDSKWAVALGLAMLGLDDQPAIGIEIATKTKNFIRRWLRAFMP